MMAAIQFIGRAVSRWNVYRDWPEELKAGK